MSMLTPPSAAYISSVVAAALAEDIGRGDLTTLAVVSPRARATANLVFRVPGVVCGLPIALEAFRQLDPSATLASGFEDGVFVSDAQRLLPVARVTCSMSALLTAERVALNIVGRLSGIATLTRRYVELVEGTGVKILDTRKTTPGLRLLEKYAVRAGGGKNHRLGLDDGILLKDNHLRLVGSISEAVRRARLAAPPAMKVEVEVETLAELEEALAAGADMLLLDNMPLELLRASVELVAKRVPLEASGGITFATVRALAETGVDYISVGALTHSASALDVSLEVPV